MIRPDGQPILTAAAMRAAEDRAIAAGASVETLMERAGAGVAEAVRRLAAGTPVLVLCGPGSNGGDGYVAARVLRANGVEVRVAALGEPKSEAAAAARAAWTGTVEDFHQADHANIVVDALFGTGLTRALDARLEQRWRDLVTFPRLAIAVDVPSGLDSDAGDAAATRNVAFDITLALGALKPAHVLHPAAAQCGTIRLVDLGLGPMRDHPDRVLERPSVAAPGPSDHKFTRGLIVAVGGAMTGAANLAAEAALYAGAGYVTLLADDHGGRPPDAMVRRAWSADTLTRTLDGKRLEATAIIVGPGLGRDANAAERLRAAIATGYPVVIDGDALHLLQPADFAAFKARPSRAPVILTPHAGEFKALFGAFEGNKIEATRAAADRAGATVVFKGPDTVVAHPDGRTVVAVASNPWLSTAGTGDVLAGTIAAMLAAGPDDPAAAGVWMHGEAARRLGGAFIADDLARALSAVRAAL